MTRVLATLAVVALSLALFLSSRPGNALLARILADTMERFVFNEADLRIQRLKSRFPNRLRIYDLRVTQAGETTVEIDSLTLRFRILPLLRRSFHIKDLHLWGPQLVARQLPDSTWNLASLLQPDKTPDEPSTWRVRLDTVSVTDGFADIRPLRSNDDSLIAIRMPLAAASDMLFGRDPPHGNVHSLTLSASGPEEMPRIDLGLAGALTGTAIVVDTLFLQSEHSSLHGSGTLPLDVRDMREDRFELVVPRLAFSDLRLFLPGLDSLGWMSGRADVVGTGDSLDAVARLESADGMASQLNAHVQIGSGGRFNLDFSGSIARLDPAYLSGNPSLQGQLNSGISGTVAGTSLSDADGSLTFEMTPSQWLGGTISGVQLDVVLANGEADARFEARAFDAEAHVQVEGRLFDEVPSYQMAARMVDFRFPLQPSTPALVGLTGTVEVEGSGLDAASASLVLRSKLEHLSIGTCAFPNSALDAKLDGGSLTASVNMRGIDDNTPGPTISGGGEIEFDAPGITIHRLDAAFAGVDPSCLSPDMEVAGLSGAVALRGTWTDQTNHDVTGELQLLHSTYGSISIDSLNVHALTRNGLFNLQASLTAGDGILEATGKGSFAATPWPFSLSGSLRHLDASQFFPPNGSPSDLSASFESSGLVGPTGLKTAAMDLTLLESRWNEQVLSHGALEARLDEEALRFVADLRTPDGGLHAEGTGLMSEGQIRFDPIGATFESVDPASLFNREAMETSLSGRLDGWIELRGSGRLAADLVLAMEPSTVNRSTISQGTTRLLADGNEVRLQVDAQVGSGHLFAAAVAYPWEPQPHYEALARIQDLDLAALASMAGPPSRFSGAAAFSLDLKTEGLVSAGGMVSLGSSTIAEVELDTVLAEASFDGGMLRIDTLWIASNAGFVAGSGPIALTAEATAPSDFRAGMTIDALANLRSLTNARVLEGKGSVAGRLSGTFERQRFELIPDLEYVIFDALRVAGLRGRFGGEKPFTTAWEVDLQAGFIANPYVPVQEVDLEIEGGEEEALWRTRIVIDRQRSVRMEGRLEMDADVRRLLFDDVRIQLGPDTWSLLQEASLTLQTPFRIRNFLIAAGSQQLAIDGIVDLKGDLNLIVTTEGLRAGAVADLFGYQGLDGELNTFLVLSGTADQPEISGGFRLDDIVSRGRDVGSLNTELQYAGGRLNLDARLRSVRGQELSASGFIPIVLSLTGLGEVPETLPTDLTIQTQDFPIGWIMPFLDPTLVTALDGVLTADIRVGGTQGAPDLSGSATVSRGSITLPNTRVPYRDISIQTRLSGRSVHIDQAELHSGGGSMRASGTVEFVSLTDHHYDLKIDAEDFRAIHTDTYRATIGGHFLLGGTSDAPTLTGDLRAGPMDVFLTEELTAQELEPVQLTARDLQILEARFGYRISTADTTSFDFYKALSMNLSVEIDRDVWLRSAKAPQMDVEFNGRIDVTKEPYRDPLLYGTIQVNPRRSVVKQYGRRFEVRTGTLRFNGPFEEILVDFRAAYVVPARRGESGPTIFLDIEGRFESLQIVPSSEPAMEMIDIVSYIATGRPAAEGLFGGGGGLDAQAAGLALGQLGMLIEGVAGEGLGLDVVEIENDGLRGATFTVGKYVHLEDLQLYVSIKQPFNLSKAEETARTTRNTEAAVEVQLFRSMLVRLTSRSRSLRFDLLYEYAY